MMPRVAQGFSPQSVTTPIRRARRGTSLSETDRPLVTTQKRRAPFLRASDAASRTTSSDTSGYTFAPALLLADWAQKEQSSGQAPDLAFTIEQRSSLFPDRIREVLLVEHYTNYGTLAHVFTGQTAHELYATIIARELLSRLDQLDDRLSALENGVDRLEAAQDFDRRLSAVET